MEKNKKIILGITIVIMAIIGLIALASSGSDTTNSSISDSGNSDHKIGGDEENDIFAKEFNSVSEVTYTLKPNLDYDTVEKHFVEENMKIKKLNPEFAGSTIGAGIETKDYHAFALMINGEYSTDIIYEKTTGKVKNYY